MTPQPPLAFFEVGFGEMLVVGVVALLLFGGRLPEVMRSLGASYRSLRRGFDDLSRQALRPDATPYRPIPPASSRVAPSASEPTPAPAPWAPVASPGPTTAPGGGEARTPPSSPSSSPSVTPPPRTDDDAPFV